MLTENEAVLYGQSEAFSADVMSELSKDGITLKPYNGIYEDIKCIPDDKTVIIDGSKANYAIVKNIPENVKVKVKSSSIFGGVSNKQKFNEKAETYTIYINATCLFGGVEIK